MGRVLSILNLDEERIHGLERRSEEKIQKKVLSYKEMKNTENRLKI